MEDEQETPDEFYKFFTSKLPELGPIHEERKLDVFNAFDFGPLRFRVPPLYAEPRPRTLKDAKLRVKDYVAEKDVRFRELEGFLALHGQKLSGALSDINELSAFYARSVFCNDDGSDLHPMWIGFAWSYALYLGELMITRGKERGLKRRWVLQDVSIAQFGEPPRFMLQLGGQRYKLHAANPEETLIGLGRFMLQHPRNKTTFGPDVPDQLSRLRTMVERDVSWTK